MSFLLLGALISPLSAQTVEEESLPPSLTGSAVDLTIRPRFGVGYSTSGASYDAFTSFEGFVPLLQTPGSTLTFLEGRLLLDNDANLGGNLLLGHRVYNPTSNRVLGAYLAYDNRSTGSSTFNQVSAGFESLGEILDFRGNVYVPIGDTRRLVEETGFDTGLLVSDAGFSGNFLTITGSREGQINRRFEAAMTGVDVEGGARLVRIGTRGDIRGYVGGYFYDAPSSDEILGWKARLEVRPTDYFRFGLSVQDDDTFGTNVIFNVAANFPGTRPRGSTQSQEVLARLGESVARQNNIIVDEQVEFESFNENFTTLVTNPATGQSWQFRHVNPNGGAGDGTFENPAGTIGTAVGVAQAGDIVYVQAGTSPGGFTIPDGVQLWSTGPEQQINTVELGTVQLAGSGSGELTTITDTVTLGNNTLLSGFAVSGVTGAGIVATNISNAEIRDSTITSSSEAGIFLGTTTGTVTVTNSSITGEGVAAIAGTNINNVAIANTNLTSRNSTTNGISLDTVTGTLTFTNSPIIITTPTVNGISVVNATGSISTDSAITITNPTVNGISVVNATGSISTDSAITITNPAAIGISVANTTGSISFTGNNESEITNAGSFGVSLSNSPGAIALSGFQISDSGDSGISGENLSNVTLSGNTITNARNEGIALSNTAGTVAIDNNTITDTIGVNAALLPSGQGISLQNVTGTVAITNNTVSGTTGFIPGGSLPLPPSGQGISLLNTAGNVELTISGNRAENNFEDAIAIALTGTAQGDLTITNNIITGNGTTPGTPIRGDGIFVNLDNAAEADLTISDNQITNNNDDGIDIRMAPVVPPLFPVSGRTPVLRATISNNTIDGQTNGSGINIIIDDNARFDTSIRLNSLTNNSATLPDLNAVTRSTANLCLGLNGNISTTGFQLTQTAGTLRLEDTQQPNNGTVTQTGTITNVPAGTCNER
jgi:parallel beta-helix repeat protein